MIKKYNYKIAGIATFAGFAINNVKAAADTKVYVEFGGKTYFEATKGLITKDNLSSLDNLIKELATLKADNILKKDGTIEEDKLDLKDISEKYFVKSVKIGNAEKLTGVTLVDLSVKGLTIDDKDNKLTVELVKKESRIKITYDSNLKGARLTKANEEKILANILQGKKNSEISGTIGLNNLEFVFGGKNQAESSQIIGTGLKLFAGNEKIDFKITKLPDTGFKTVVCNFASGVEAKLVAGVDLEKLCVAGTALNNKKLNEVFTALNNIQLTSENVNKFFNDSVKLKIKCNGTDEIDNDTKTTKNLDTNFIVIDNIEEKDINPIFLKKTFKVELNNEGNEAKQVAPKIIEAIKNNLKTKFEDSVVITVQDIINSIKNVVNPDKPEESIFVKTPFTKLDNVTITGVASTNGKLEEANKVNSAEIKISIKEAEFTEGVVTIKLELKVSFNDPKRGNKTLKPAVKDAIEKIIKDITTKLNIDEFVEKFNNDTTIATVDSKQFDKDDFTFGSTLEGTYITKNGTITIGDKFFVKLTDDCFEEKKDNGGGDSQKGSSDSSGDTKNGGSGSGNTPKKGCCNSNKGNK